MLPSGAPEYPVETFWAERFLKHPNEVISGPIRKPEWSMHETRGRSSQKTVEDDRTAKILSGSSSTTVLLCAIAAGLTHIAGLKGTDRTQLSNLICSRPNAINHPIIFLVAYCTCLYSSVCLCSTQDIVNLDGAGVSPLMINKHGSLQS
ncbi:hypothetical protein V8F06_013446 [Rhypophila decipiens]